jgi:hypothetical protein
MRTLRPKRITGSILLWINWRTALSSAAEVFAGLSGRQKPFGGGGGPGGGLRLGQYLGTDLGGQLGKQVLR